MSFSSHFSGGVNTDGRWRGGDRDGELTVAPFQPVVLADGVPTKTDAAVDEAEGGALGEVRACGEACGEAGCEAGEDQEDGREDGCEPRHGA